MVPGDTRTKNNQPYAGLPRALGISWAKKASIYSALKGKHDLNITGWWVNTSDQIECNLMTPRDVAQLEPQG
jgi:hypothetical protein